MVKGRALADYAIYDATGNGSRPGLHVKEEQARICWETCDWADEDECVCDGVPKPRLMRCALERHLAAERNGGSKSKIPDGYLTIRQVAWYQHRSVDDIWRRVQRGEFPGAKRLNGGKTAPWLIPDKFIK